MNPRTLIPGLITVAYLAAIALLTFSGLDLAWGVNHFRFLATTNSLVLAALFLLSVVVALTFSESKLSQWMTAVHDLLWEKSIWIPILLALLSMPLFYFFRAGTHFLGDGYTWLSTFGGGQGYIPKWSEFGAIEILRLIQAAVGGYTQESARLAFQILSITSGALFIFGSFLCLRYLTQNKLARLPGLILLLGGGQALLFFGYIEFYHLSWTVAIFLFGAAFRYAARGAGLLALVIAYLLALLVHVQVIYFLPALLWLLIASAAPDRFKKLLYTLLITLCTSGGVLLIYLIRTRIEIEVLFIPLISGRPNAPGYYLFSLPHLSDIVQQILLIIPPLPILIYLTLGQWRGIFRDRIASFLLLASAGSLSFLVLFGAALTRARDWDIFSLCLLAPILLIIRLIGQSDRIRSLRAVGMAGALTILMTGGYLVSNLNTDSSVRRYYSILNYSDSRAGWTNLATYYEEQGDTTAHGRIINEMNERFPGYTRLQRGYAYLNAGRPEDALPIALSLVDHDPYDREYLKLAGSAYSKLGEYDKAEPYYNKANRLAPYLSTLKNEIGQMFLAQGRYNEALEILKEARHLSPEKTFIAEGLGLAYYRLDQYDSALAVADSLFADDPNSPGGHLLGMVVAISTGKNDRARYHYTEFLRYGATRSDYARIRDSYAYLTR